MNQSKNIKPKYWSDALVHLKRHDPIMSVLIKKHKSRSYLTTTNSVFTTLFKIIVGQQISIKVASSIEKKIIKHIGSIASKKILDLDSDILRACGLSYRKIDYIKRIAELIKKKPKYFSQLDSVDDENAIKNLTSIYGIGPWSAEMFLIFHFNRQNIVPLGDIGLINSFCKNYNFNKKDFSNNISKYKKIWSPYGTVATWFLWRDIDEDVVQY
jgi:DNA-3-methyladenine glycosylase II